MTTIYVAGCPEPVDLDESYADVVDALIQANRDSRPFVTFTLTTTSNVPRTITVRASQVSAVVGAEE